MMGSVLEDARLFIWRASKQKLTDAVCFPHSSSHHTPCRSFHHSSFLFSSQKYLAAIGVVFEFFAPQVLARFPPQPLFGDFRLVIRPSNDIGDKRPLLGHLGTEYIFACAARMGALLMSRKSQNPPFFYQVPPPLPSDHLLYFSSHSNQQFNQTLSWKGWGEDSEACNGHVCHGAELPFLFVRYLLLRPINLIN